MENFGAIALVAVAAVGIFVLGLSLTLIIKGHNIKSEIADNEHMRARGIKCAVAQMRDEDAACRAADGGSPLCDTEGECASCVAYSKNIKH